MGQSIHSWRLLVFGDDWGRHPSSTQHLVRRLIDEHPVTWVNSIGMRPPRVSLYDAQRVWERLRRPSRPISQWEIKEHEPTLVQPRFAPYHHVLTIRNLNQYLIAKQLRAVAEPDLSQPLVMWVANPVAAYLRSTVPYDLLVYYCGDDFSEWPGVHQKTLLEHEEELFETADLVVFSSLTLVQNKSKRVRGRVALLPHGVDLERFGQIDGLTPEPMLMIPHPVAGYFGCFAPWIKVPLIEMLAKALPSVHFCLIGALDERAKLLERLDNVHLMGPVSHEMLPRYAACFDIGLLLYDTDHVVTRSINPLKMLEYYALGLPVASTFNPRGVEGAEELFLGSSPQAMVQAVQSALQAPWQLREREKAIAQRHSWTVRARLVEQWVEQELERKGFRAQSA